jgi:DNA (cytosine-5)-methyltransferase 1
MNITHTSELNLAAAPEIADDIISVGEFFAGSGGVTHAMENIHGMKVKWVLNHDKTAIRTNIFHHQNIKHYWADIYAQDEHEMEPVDLLWASIECTQHSKAKGGKEKNTGSYMMGYELVRYFKHLMPLVAGIENVPEFKKWSPLDKNGKPDKTKIGREFENWKNIICSLGYTYTESIRNAADDGIPTRRVRYFAFFIRNDVNIDAFWPEHTHNKAGTDGKKKWEACRKYLDLTDEGRSIFGREKPLCQNTLKRIAGGIRKFCPELNFVFQYYSNGDNVQSIEKPLNTVTTKDRHVLVSLEKMKFVQDHIHTDNYNGIDDPLNPQLCRQTKQLISVDKQFINDYYTNEFTNHPVDEPIRSITGWNSKKLVSVKSQFIHKYYGGAWKNRKEQHHCQSLDEPMPTITTADHNTVVSSFISIQNNCAGHTEASNSSIDGPLNSLTTKEKMQFITTYFNSNGNPGSQNQSIDSPLNTVLTGQNKKALITTDTNLFDFDIKMRFLSVKELSLCSTFPGDYFTKEGLKLSTKDAIRLIGNAVPPMWVMILLKPAVAALQNVKQQIKQTA